MKRQTAPIEAVEPTENPDDMPPTDYREPRQSRRRPTNDRLPKRMRQLVGVPDPAHMDEVADSAELQRIRDPSTPAPGVLAAAEILYMAGYGEKHICKALRIRPCHIAPCIPEWKARRPQHDAAVQSAAVDVARHLVEERLHEATKDHLEVGKTLRARIADALAAGELTPSDIDRLAKAYKTEADVSHRMSGVCPTKPTGNSRTQVALLFGVPVRPLGDAPGPVLNVASTTVGEATRPTTR